MSERISGANTVPKLSAALGTITARNAISDAPNKHLVIRMIISTPPSRFSTYQLCGFFAVGTLLLVFIVNAR